MIVIVHEERLGISSPLVLHNWRFLLCIRHVMWYTIRVRTVSRWMIIIVHEEYNMYGAVERDN
jgi:hypothetical protein